jgi:hypothetical protein
VAVAVAVAVVVVVVVGESVVVMTLLQLVDQAGENALLESLWQSRCHRTGMGRQHPDPPRPRCGGAPTHLGDAAGRGNARAAWEGGSADHA